MPLTHQGVILTNSGWQLKCSALNSTLEKLILELRFLKSGCKPFELIHMKLKKMNLITTGEHLPMDTTNRLNTMILFLHPFKSS